MIISPLSISRALINKTRDRRIVKFYFIYLPAWAVPLKHYLFWKYVMKVCQVKQKWKILKERTPFTTDTAKFSEGRIRWSYGVSWWFQCTTPAFRRTFQNNYSQLPSILVFILFFWEEQLKKYALFSGGSRKGARGPGGPLPLYF